MAKAKATATTIDTRPNAPPLARTLHHSMTVCAVARGPYTSAHAGFAARSRTAARGRPPRAGTEVGRGASAYAARWNLRHGPAACARLHELPRRARPRVRRASARSRRHFLDWAARRRRHQRWVRPLRRLPG